MKKILYSLVLGTLTLASCTTGGVMTIETPVDKQSVEVAFSNVTTKATSGTFEVDDKIGIYALVDGSSAFDQIYNNYTNFQYKYNAGGTLSPLDKANTMFFPLDGSKIDFIAYYPYNAGAVNAGHIITISALNQDPATNKDIFALYSDNAKGFNKNTITVPLNFRYMMSKIVVKLNPGTGMAENLLTGMSMTVAGVSTSVDMDLRNLANTNETNVADVAALATSDANKEIVFYIVPQVASANMRFDFKDVNGGEYKYYVPNSHTFEPSKVYQYDLKFNNITFSGEPTILDWIPGATHTGDADQN